MVTVATHGNNKMHMLESNDFLFSCTMGCHCLARMLKLDLVGPGGIQVPVEAQNGSSKIQVPVEEYVFA